MPATNIDHPVDPEQLRAYHAACGLDPDSSRAAPLFLAALTLPASIRLARAAVPASLHAGGLQIGHEVTLQRAITVGMRLTTRATSEVRTSRAGEIVTVTATSTAGGERAAAQRIAFLFRDPDPGKRTDPAPTAETPGTVHATTGFPPGTAQAYAAAARDDQAIHLDDEAAQRAGLPRTIAHGLCTLAFVAAAAARSLGHDPHGLRTVAARFTGLAFWDDRIDVRSDPADDGGEHAFTASAGARTLISHGRIAAGTELAGPAAKSTAPETVRTGRKAERTATDPAARADRPWRSDMNRRTKGTP